MNLRKLVITFFAALICTATFSCKNKGKADDSAAAASYGNNFGLPGNTAAYNRYGSGSNIALPSRQAGASFTNSSKGEFPPVYFQFNSFEVSPSEQAKIQEIASYARSQGKELILAGFTDNVGTEEYNRGLGDRRALAVRSALMNRGVNITKVQTVSFGEEMPADPSNPSSGRNRRVEFGIVR
jgi:peptidoglycan-associated lipoprotein|tara:strand:- start:863 stop:1411 length:549 start_codon:yes stop_codon:yes gene_type:complete